MKEITELKRLVSIIENLENFQNIYPLDSDQKIQLSEAKKRMYELIKKLK